MMMNSGIVLVALIVIAMIVGGVLLALTIATVTREHARDREAAEAAKPKRREDDDSLDRLAEDDMVWLEDDGELPEDLADMLDDDEKPKRHDQG